MDKEAQSLEILKLSLTNLSIALFQKDIMKYDDEVALSYETLKNTLIEYQILKKFSPIIPEEKYVKSYGNEYKYKPHCICGNILYKGYIGGSDNYCSKCGREILWDKYKGRSD